MTAFVFPGQGSQKRGMGERLFDEVPEYTSIENEVDGIVGYSMRRLCLEDAFDRLQQTQYTQPALYVVNALHYYKAFRESGRPDALAGHSLGEFNALHAAGVFDFVTGLKLVRRRGELMSQEKDGGMGAVVGLSAATVASVLADNGLSSIDIANLNSGSQLVVSGPVDDIRRAGMLFEKAGARLFMPLRVSAAFHSRYMEKAAKAFADFLAPMTFACPHTCVVANATARPYPTENVSADVKSLLVGQITLSVQWVQTVRYLLESGVGVFKELGPGTVLTRLVREIEQEVPPRAEQVEVLEEDQRCPKDPEVRPSEDVAQVDDKSSRKALPVTRVTHAAASREETVRALRIDAESLGSAEFKRDYRLRYAYMAGAMFKGIASKELVVAMGKAGMMGYLGTGGLAAEVIEESIRYITQALPSGEPFGMNLLCNLERPELEEHTVDLFLKHGVRYVEAAAFLQMTRSLVRWRLSGLKHRLDGTVERPHRILAKVSRPEVAAAFMRPAPEAITRALLASGKISVSEAELSRSIPMADEICVEADSAGHTDQGVAYALMPAMMALRDQMMEEYKYERQIKIGAAGGIGAPHAAAAAFIMGADFILTGSINQCTVEAGTSSAVKDILQELNVQDTEYAPAGDMFELGARVQVVKRGLFFPARANKLYELYQRHNSIEEIDPKTLQQIQDRYFKRSVDDVWRETKQYHQRNFPNRLAAIEASPKQKMAHIFKWYFVHSSRLAMSGSEEQRVDYQIHCGPALGAFNQWVKRTDLASWRNRYVADIGKRIMDATAQLLASRFKSMSMAGCGQGGSAEECHEYNRDRPKSLHVD